MMNAQGPLKGIRVLDLSRILAGPFCTTMLSDLGAEIIKLESPGNGDETRTWGPPFEKGESAYFLGVNHGKKSIVVDLKKSEGLEVARAIAKKVDVFVENFRPGVVDRLGVGYEALSALNPRLIYVSVSGFGQTGPYRERSGFDIVGQAMSGIMSATGEPDGGPCKAGVPLSDLTAGMWAAYSVSSALFAREKTGRGQYIDLSLLDSSVSLLTNLSGCYFMDGSMSERWGSAHFQIVPYQALKAKDKEIIIGVTSDRFWGYFCDIIEAPELTNDPRFVDIPNRAKNRAQLIPILERYLCRRNGNEWLKLLEEKGIPCGPVYDVGEALEDEQVRHREMVVETEHSLLGKMNTTGVPPKFSEQPGKVQGPAPLHGEHTREVLSEILGWNDERIEELVRDSVVSGPKPRSEIGIPLED